MSEVVIYHNPRCSKSRAALALLQQRGLTPTVIEYLKSPPSTATLAGLLQRLGMTARQLLRTGETTYERLGLAAVNDESALIRAMHDHPELIERPIVVAGGKARLGRPPEAVLDILPR